MLWLFRKFFDPNAAREEAEEQRRQREDWPPGYNPDNVDAKVPEREAEPVPCKCRVCGYQAVDERYCPTCLAETMEPLPRS
jgi:hypothetical protein